MSTGFALGFALFGTAIGRSGIAWGAAGITGVQLPEASDIATHARLRRRRRGEGEAVPPPDIQHVIDRIVALVAGEPDDLRFATLDMTDVSDFDRRVYDVARAIPPGRTLTYGEVAARLGDPALARAVGQALGRNPFAIIVPCHRVVGAGGGIGGFSAHGGRATKTRLLDIERGQPLLVITTGLRAEG